MADRSSPRQEYVPGAGLPAIQLLRQLQDITETLAGTTQATQVFEVILSPALQALGAAAGTVLLLTEGRLQATAALGQGEVASLWQDGPLRDRTPTSDVLRSHTPLFFEHSDDLKRAYPDLERRTGGRATVANAVLPMVLDGRALGVIVLDFLQAHDFVEVERTFLRVLSAQCALALGRIEHSGRQERRVEESTRALQAFAALTEAVGTETDLSRLARRAIEVVRTALPELSVAYHELDGGRWKARELSADIPAEAAEISRAGHAASTPSFLAAVQARAPVFVEGYDAGREGVVGAESYGAAAFYPYFVKGRPTGMLVVGTRRSQQWTAADRALVGAVGRSLGLAFERTHVARQLYERSHELAARTRALEGFSVITRTLSPGSDPYVLIRQAQALVLSMLPEGYAIYYELADGRWVSRVQTGAVRDSGLQALMDAGFDFEAPQSLVIPWTSRRPLYQDEYLQGRDTPPERVAHISTIATLPVLQAGEPVGVMAFVLFAPRRWSGTDQAVMETTVRSLGLTLERAQQARRLEEERAALDAFVAFTEASATATDILALARQAVNVLRTTLADISAVYYELEGELWKARVWSDDFAPEVTAVLSAGIPVDAPSYAEVMRTRELVLVPGWEAAREGVSNSESFGAGAFYPCFVGDGPHGLLGMGIQRAQDWTVREREVFRAVGRSLTLALERAEIVRQHEAQELATLLARTQAEQAQREAERQRQAAERMAHLAHHDALTGLPNRAGLSARLAQAISDGTPLALLYLDLDGFKAVNDTLGHDAGDALLMQIADALRGELRSAAEHDPLLARIGGDEFTVMLTGVMDEAQPGAIAQRLNRALQRPFPVAGQDLFVTGSTGISLFPEDGQTPDDLLKNADLAMYQVKRELKNGWRRYRPSMTQEAQTRLLVTSGLRDALERSEFQLHYQPQIDLKSGEVMCLEALLRWFPEGGVPVPPDLFIPAAEASGLIIELGQWVLGAACAQLAAWHRSGFPRLRVAINVSPLQFARPDFAQSVERALEQAGLEASALELELTERGELSDLPAVLGQFRALQHMGVHLALDDFGAGESNLGRLLHLPFDVLKLDHHLIASLGTQPEAQMFLPALQTFASSLNLELVAEGIETEAQLEAVRALGCQRAQGYLLGRPAAVWPPEPAPR
ncbi:EAL domain-containing protein [Deinococcus koreensis]|uniref:Diguanylate cyclase n=1 Tax=Deinococcus koreensis TaxID=2054903 RepID=A0A2K3UTL9_9DEIO|nr:EAL domain-containing protein [Deinococcus koreensis]PNY79877.1 hypothetical protein CVO96_18235 [Deinococcus koreensis]